MSRSIYKGAALQLVDDKNRVAIPAPLRNTALANSPDGDTRVTISVSPDQKCLWGYDLPWGIVLNEEVRRQTETTDKKLIDLDHRRRMINGEDVTFDASGRFLLNGFHKRKARIGKFAYFYGVGDHFEIWDPGTLIATDDYEIMRDNLEYLLEEKGIAM